MQDLENKLASGKVELSLKLILETQEQVTRDLIPSFESGKLRMNPVVVNDPRTGQDVYLPPDVKDVKPLIEILLSL